MTLEVQFLTMVHMTGAGIFLGMCHATYARLCIRRQRPFGQAIQDILFWLFNGLLVFMWLQWVNDGEIRIYIFLSLLLGFSIYKALLESIFLRLLDGLITSVISVFRFLKRVVFWTIIRPVILIYQLLMVIAAAIVGLVWKILLFLWRAVVFLVRPLRPIITRLTIFKAKNEDPAENPSKKPKEKKGVWRRMAKWWKRKDY